MRQSVCRKTLHMRSHEQPPVPWLSSLPGAGAPQPVPDLGDTQRAPARPRPFSPWLSSSSREGPKPLFLHVPEGPGGSGILPAWDADPGSMGHRLPLRAQLGPRVHVCTCPVPATCIHRVPVCACAVFTPTISELEPLQGASGDGDGVWVTPGPHRTTDRRALGWREPQPWADTRQGSGRHQIRLGM